MRVANKVAVITGGASGIGRATALALARREASVVIADVHAERLASTREELGAHGCRAVAVRCDVSRDEDVERLARETIAAFGAVDILMNNAGVIARGVLERIEMADWQWAFDINVFGVIRGVRAFLPGMLARGSGYIVNTGSVAGLIAPTGEGAPYVATKFAVTGYTEALALYARPRGVGVSLLCPGGVDTNLLETQRAIGFDSPEQEAAEHAVARAMHGAGIQTPEEVAEAVIAGIEAERFLIMPDTFHQPMVEHRARDLSAFVEWRIEQAGQAARETA
jgi:NAD(P)-dependent dehydrogenase (short-subunit alcohol dehydrogenase family)